MTIETLKAISYITSVAAEELPILKWIAILGSIYTDGIPEETTMATAINYYVEKFPGFEERAKDDSQNGYDNLYNDFMSFITTQIESNKNN